MEQMCCLLCLVSLEDLREIPHCSVEMVSRFRDCCSFEVVTAVLTVASRNSAKVGGSGLKILVFERK